MRGSSSFLYPTAWETEAQRSKWPARAPVLVSEQRAAPTLAHTLTPLRRDRNLGGREEGGGELPDSSTQTCLTLDKRHLVLVHSFPVAGAE